MNKFTFKKLLKTHVWKRILVERLTEPLHLNIISIFIVLFGTFRMKVSFDLVVRQHTAYCLLKCADNAKKKGIKTVTVVEFGVAAGAGLLNMANIAKNVTKITGVNFQIIGMDSGQGMPAPIDYRDHPDLYQEGDFMMDIQKLEDKLPDEVTLIIGDLKDTISKLIDKLSPESPLGYVCLDVDYYSSSKIALTCLESDATNYLPVSYIYLDDLEDSAHNSNCGELLAVKEINDNIFPRIIERHNFLRSYRIMKNPRWIDHVFTYHVVDHPSRTSINSSVKNINLDNPYL